MKCKYKKFLKAAYINYDEDYCSYGSSTFTKPTITTPIIVIMGTTAIIACAISGVTIYYTLDGSTPTSSSTKYTGTITLTLSCVIKAIAVKPGMSDSEVASENYVHYLTAWRLVGNSTVHTDEYLTQWKVSGNSQIQQYLTQWKVEGNSVVDNNAILSCGDLGQDGKYHVKISNGVDVFDISLDEPLRKINDVADSIEFADGVTIVTRNIAKTIWNNLEVKYGGVGANNYMRFYTSSLKNVIYIPSSWQERVLCCMSADFIQDGAPVNLSDSVDQCMCVERYTESTAYIFLRDTSVNNPAEFKAKYGTHEFLYRLKTPITETIQAPQISVSSTNTYSSANDTPYSAFTYANPLIYSCGDYSDVDGKYHVKISNGVTIFDIPLTEPLRKVGDVADSIEFINGVATVTRVLASADMGTFKWEYRYTNTTDIYRMYSTSINSTAKPTPENNNVCNILCAIYDPKSTNAVYTRNKGLSIGQSGEVEVYDPDYNQLSSPAAFKAAMAGVELIYELATPTTEVIQVSPFPISATDTYTSVNDTPYSAFEYKKNVEIWSCGEYNPTDGKYHILVQPLGGSIADIALDEPLRKDNDVADSIEFVNGVATLTRAFDSVILSNLSWRNDEIYSSGKYRFSTASLANVIKRVSDYANILTPLYNVAIANDVYAGRTQGISVANSGGIFLYDENYNQVDDLNAFKAHINGVEFIYELATPITETIQVPQIQEAESYTCVISQGGKAVEWSSFETE